MSLELTDSDSPLAVPLNYFGKNKKLQNESKWEISGVIAKVVKYKAIRITRIIKMDQYYTNNYNTDSSNVSKNDIDT